MVRPVPLVVVLVLLSLYIYSSTASEWKVRNLKYNKLRYPSNRIVRQVIRQNGYRPRKSLYKLYSRPQKKKCRRGYVRKIDGKCARPVINKNIYMYQPPEQKVPEVPLPEIPKPQIDYNYLFIKSPSAIFPPDPLVVPPARQKTVVYLLSEEPSLQTQPVIEVESKVSKPEVFFIKYKEGDNPKLPGGINLQTALQQSISVPKSSSSSQLLSVDDEYI